MLISLISYLFSLLLSYNLLQEQLGADEKFLCSKCHTRQESIKQLTMKSLPVVVSADLFTQYVSLLYEICLHLKRFEQIANTRSSNKIDTFIEFPSVLDMSPYTSHNVTLSKTSHTSNKCQKTKGSIFLFWYITY